MKTGDKAEYLFLKILCKGVGYLPDWILYSVVRWIIYVVLYRMAGYRKKVVRENLRNSFPGKTPGELRTTERRFYLQLAEVFIDTVLLASISESKLRRRVVFDNIELHEASVAGKDWIAAMSHYGSWEFLSGYQLYTTSQVVGVYRPLKDKAFDLFYKHMRERFGSKTVAMDHLLRYIVRYRKEHGVGPLSLGMIADQTPPHFDIHHWFDFLRQPTPFFLGIEKFALRFGMPVYFTHVDKLKPGHYRLRFDMIYDGTENVREYEITERYAAKLEGMIRDVPELWMWSHKRWKHKPY